ncbi:MAG: universal stress protein [Desulfovermiculus sp.]|nr:universal stress protein [Desulfovermiculus sp.]
MLPDIHKILYCTNLGLEAPHVFRYALSQAQHYNAVVHILHVVEPMSSFARGLVEQYISSQKFDSIHEESRKYVLDRIKRRVSAFCDKETCNLLEGNDLMHGISVLEGQPMETILKTGQELPADLIVLGSHRRKHLEGPGILGSTARKIVNTSTIPVLTVYTPDDKMEELE